MWSLFTCCSNLLIINITFLALEAWNIAKTVQGCEKIEKQAKKAAKEVAEKLETSYELVDNATWLYNNATEVGFYLSIYLCIF